MSDEKSDSPEMLMTPTQFLPKSDESLSPNNDGSRNSNRATPAVLGPTNPKLPNYKRNKKGDLILQKWVETDLPTVAGANRENISRVKVEVDCARYKLAAEDATSEVEKLRQQLRESEENCAQLKIRLNEERARHAETADQSRALTHLAAQLRAKTEKYETVITKQESNAKRFQTTISNTDEKLKLQDARVDALARICSALEQQLRDAALKGGALPNSIDVAAVWRQKAYKAMVQLNHTEQRLTVENKALRRSLSRSRPLPHSPKSLKSSPNRSPQTRSAPSPNRLPPPDLNN